MATKDEAKKKAQTALQKSGEDQRVVVFKRMLLGMQKAISAALPKHMTPERMMRVVTTAAQTNQKLFECSVSSLQKSIIEASQLGLEPTGVLGHAYLIPYRIKGAMECQLQIGFKGMIELAMRSGRVDAINAMVVYDCDAFTWVEGLEPRLVHEPSLSRPPSAKPTCAYAVARMKGGSTAHAVLPLHEIEKRRAASRAPEGGPWDTHWDAMARKSAIRELAKYLPQSPELQRAAVADEAREEGRQAIDVDFAMVDSGEAEKPIPGGAAPTRLSTPAGDVLVSAVDGKTEVVDAETGEVLTEEAYVNAGPPDPDKDGKE